jgi:hypothetical protein
MNWTCKSLSVVLLLIANSAFNAAEAQYPRISEWVEDAPASDPDRIALGYPVPIPVDTPLPFDGFRSYNGLHTRHQDLANTTDWVHGFEIGQTTMARSIWTYQLGDADHLTKYGFPEHAMLTNGGIHAREWQSPEVVSGVIELLAASEEDHHLISYLRDNTNVLVIPVLNVDGFLQTQRYPSTNWMGTDLDSPESSPRDGRMRRKNMLGADENLLTQEDHLNGVDLNRNNAPFWNTNPDGSSDIPGRLTYHGESAGSEPETQALDAAAQLGPADRLTMFTDVHSFGQVQFWTVTENAILAELTDGLLTTVKNHHFGFDAQKYYWSDTIENVAQEQPIGSTDEYFASTYQVPAWILEVEPSAGYHDGLPGHGADYGGLSRNGHDGFILPEFEIERVRTELAQTFAVAYYRQAGPPSITDLRLIDDVTGATVYEAEWDKNGDNSRGFYSFQVQPLQLDRVYRLWLAFDKPMRWRENGEIVALQGQPEELLGLDAMLGAGNEMAPLSANTYDAGWIDQPGEAPDGYRRYRDDSLYIDFNLLADENNLALIDGTTTASMAISAYDMTGVQVDADPSTAVHWDEGGWSGYENSEGLDRTNTGGYDQSFNIEVTSEALADPFVVEAGTSSAWYDPAHDGEGFMLEILPNDRAAMYWFTYDTEGNQDWYVGVGRIRGNRILFPKLMKSSGGEFGPDFDPDKVTRSVVGSASFIWSGCDTGTMEWVIDSDGNGWRQGRMELQRLTTVMGIECGNHSLPPEIDAGLLSGSWYDPTHDGEGYVLEVLADQRVLVYWFSYDQQANRRWFFGLGRIQDDKIIFNNMRTTHGGIFGAGFDPLTIERTHWGVLELELQCGSGTASFTPSEPGFPAGTLDLVRLTLLEGFGC